MMGPSQSVLVASVELCFPLVLTDAPAFSPPLLAAASHQWSFPRPAPHWLLIVYHVWSASLQGCTSVLLFWFHLLGCFFFLFLKLHQGTRTHAQTPRRPVPPPKPRRSKKGVSRCRLQPSTSVLCPLTSDLCSLFALLTLSVAAHPRLC